ncbi:MAG: 4-alpha-glucanotransferase [Candidatus Omnitrophica bacterium]|nr:4-alpha-glucanotransferase [Candidatus Omnitrophota bacterium]MBU1924330.1 4-alpha-glucanotransferase [Candidatus Omnitrophota bacterium]
MSTQKSGILLHISSLPSAFGIGDLGPGAYKFVDFLNSSGQSLWQILPLNPTGLVNGNSPYSSSSAFAASPLFISPQLMVKDGLLTKTQARVSANMDKTRVDYEKVCAYKKELFQGAYERFKKFIVKSAPCRNTYETFCRQSLYWLEDFAAFSAFKEYFEGKVWSDWPEKIRDREPKALRQLKTKLKDNIEREKFLQCLFFKQWRLLKEYCQKKNVRMIGDLPIYVTYDSADVWSHPGIFKLAENKKLDFVAGVPPDYFSKTGQLWGNPVYNWPALKSEKYVWWRKRIEYNLKLFDQIRIDHFRGFVDFWQIPAGEITALNGAWQKAPAKDFFTSMKKRFTELPIIAEDLGIITDEVREIIRYFGFPGMKVLMFAFGEDNPKHPYLPHNYVNNCVAYTGTHDNNTLYGWYEHDMAETEKKRLIAYLEVKEIIKEEFNWELIKLIMNSAADTVIIPLQDVLGLGQECRMNLPSTTHNNWQWRVLLKQLTPEITKRLSQLTLSANRR